jgi:hypothetical protein
VSVGGLIGLRFFTQTFAYFVGPDAGFSGSIKLPGAPFIASLMLRSAAVIAWRTTKAEG